MYGNPFSIDSLVGKILSLSTACISNFENSYIRFEMYTVFSFDNVRRNLFLGNIPNSYRFHQIPTPQKSNIDTKNCVVFFYRVLPFPNHHFGTLHVSFRECR